MLKWFQSKFSSRKSIFQPILTQSKRQRNLWNPKSAADSATKSTAATHLSTCISNASTKTKRYALTDVYKSSMSLRKNQLVVINAPSAVLAMVPSQPSDCISITSTARKTKMIRRFTMTNRSRSVDVTWSINPDQHSICTLRRSTEEFIPQEQLRNQMQEGIKTEMM